MPTLSPTPLAADPGHQDADAVSALLRQRLQLSDATVEPYYRQLQRQIQALIDSGALADGDSLPSERELADILQVSRSTVKRGYDGLRETRALVSTQGRGGTLVRSSAPRISPVMSMLKGFTDEMREMGLEPSTRVLECAVVQERTVASIFDKTSSASFLKLVRLRFGDAVPMSREIAWYDLAAAPALAGWDGQGSAYAFLRERCGIRLAWAQQSMEAVLSSAEETQAFGFAQPGPCLLLKRSSHDADGRLIEYVEGTFRGDAYVYRLRLQG